MSDGTPLPPGSSYSLCGCIRETASARNCYRLLCGVGGRKSGESTRMLLAEPPSLRGPRCVCKTSIKIIWFSSTERPVLQEDDEQIL